MQSLATLENDIPYQDAYRAFYAVSWRPDKRAKSQIEDYVRTLTSDFEQLLEEATTDEMKALLEAEFARYRAGYRERVLKYLRSNSRTMSSAVVGPAKFPVRQQEKRHAIVAARLNELVTYRQQALVAIRRKLHPELRPIMAGDDDAVARLQQKIDAAEKVQATMKGANVAIRKHQKGGEAAQVAALVTLGLTEAQARDLLKPDFMGRVGFPSYALTNNNANIRRMKERLADISRNQATASTTTEGAVATVEDVPADNRVRLTFPGKPDAATRERLKKAGFRWAPSLGVWQAYRNHRTLEVAQKVAAGE